MEFQLGTALLDTCVLSVIAKEDTYGYVLTQNIKELINISESTLYPVLRRLQKENYLVTYDKSYQGRNRRYYKMTDLGHKKLKEYKTQWDEYKNKIDRILEESNHE